MIARFEQSLLSKPAKFLVSSMKLLSREALRELDKHDPLRSFREKFSLPQELIYMNGNSLGAMPKDAVHRSQQIVAEQWGKRLVRSWNKANWFEAPLRIGNKIAKLIGANDNEVICTDATGINLFKALSMSLALRPERSVIVMEGSNFPANNYTAQGLIQHLGHKHSIRFVEKNEIPDAITEDVAVACLTHVHYKYGHKLDMRAINERAHSAGALVVWDLCHSAGALPVELNKTNSDFAVGCTYKYMNGGPGSPAFIFVAGRHQGKATQPLSGWWGHKNPFAFTRDYEPAGDIRQMQTGTQAMINMLIAEPGIDILLEAGIERLGEKSKKMGDIFIRLLEERCKGFDLKLVSPEDSDKRGSHIALEHEQGFAIMQALIDKNVIGDYREPRIMRFGLAPLYNSYAELWDATEALKDIMEKALWSRPEYQVRHKVS